jgi:hypothetical protein
MSYDGLMGRVAVVPCVAGARSFQLLFTVMGEPLLYVAATCMTLHIITTCVYATNGAESSGSHLIY